MSKKKRKTRAQKERAAQRRIRQDSDRKTTDNHPSATSVASETSKAPKTNNMPEFPDSPEGKNTVTETHSRHVERMRVMRVSLYVFMALVILQLIVWGLDHIGAVSLEAM